MHWFLFSFRKGWFIYAPLMILTTWGLFRFYRTRKSLALPLIVFLGLYLVVVSSWTLWWYPGGLGQRAVVDIYPIMAVGLAATLTWVKGVQVVWKVVTALFIVAAMGLNFHQTMQLRNYVHEPDWMTREYYFAAFFDTEPDPKKKELLRFHRPTTADASFENSDDHQVYGAWRHTPPDDFWVKVNGSAFFQEDPATCEVSIVTTMDHEGNHGYRSTDLEGSEGVEAGTWHPLYLTPHARRPWDHLRVSSWHRSSGPVWVRGLSIKSLARLEK